MAYADIPRISRSATYALTRNQQRKMMEWMAKKGRNENKIKHIVPKSDKATGRAECNPFKMEWKNTTLL